MYSPEKQSKDPFYRDGRIYDVMHEKLVADTNYFVEEAARIGGPVLEVACGTGRITIPIAKKGFETPQERGEIVDQSEQRCFTFNEIDALVRASGCFEMVEVIGSLKPGVSFSNDKVCWRMVPVLRRKNV